MGHIRLTGGTAELSYQAIDTNSGSLFASTRPHAIALNSEPPTPGVPGTIKLADLEIPPPQESRVATGGRITVAETEAMLCKHGYDPGPVDGILTVETRLALAAYQADSALPVNGRLTRKVADNLRRDSR